MPQSQWDVAIPLVVHVRLGANDERLALTPVRHVIEAFAGLVENNDYLEYMAPGPAFHVVAAAIELDEAASTVRASTGEELP